MSQEKPTLNGDYDHDIAECRRVIERLTRALELKQHDLEVAVSCQGELARKAVEMVKTIDEAHRQLAAVEEALEKIGCHYHGSENCNQGMYPNVKGRWCLRCRTLADLPAAAQEIGAKLEQECARLRGVIRWLYADLKAIHGTAGTAMDTARLQPEEDAALREEGK